MLSIAFASPIRRLLLVMMGVSCFFALGTQAQTVPDPCATAPASEAAAVGNSQSSIQLAAYLCGGAGQRCCPLNTCNSGLVCNSNGICRTPCGGAGERCCTGGTCNSPNLACNSSGICRTCGGSGDICCAGNTCSSGLVCNGGRCTAPCGGFGQACCSGVCYGGELICSFGTNTCIACGRLFEPCCAGNKCAVGTCNGSTCQ